MSSNSSNDGPPSLAYLRPGGGWLVAHRRRIRGNAAVPCLIELQTWGRAFRIAPEGVISRPDLDLLLRVVQENRQTAMEMAESSVRGMLALRAEVLEPESASRLRRLLAIVGPLRRDGGDLDSAIDLFELAFEIEARLDCPVTRGSLYRLAAYLLCDLGALDIARLFSKRSVALATCSPDPDGAGHALFAQAVVLDRSGHPESAIPVFRASLGYSRSDGRELRVAVRHAIACAQLQLGQVAEARAELGAAQAVVVPGQGSSYSGSLSLLSQSKLELLEAEILAVEGNIDGADGQFRRARRPGGQSLRSWGCRPTGRG